MDQAVADPKGVRVRVESEPAGIYLRMRLHQARTIDRDDNRKTYEAGHPMYGRSPYDALVFRSPFTDTDGAVWLQIDKPEAVVYEVQSLNDESEPEDNDLPNTEPRRL